MSTLPARRLAGLAIVLSLLPLSSSGVAESRRQVFTSEVTISPGAKPGTFNFRARVTESVTKKVVAGALLKVVSGTPAEAESIDPDSETKVIFKASVRGTPGTASYSLTVFQFGQLVAEHSSSAVLLQQSVAAPN